MNINERKRLAEKRQKRKEAADRLEDKIQIQMEELGYKYPVERSKYIMYLERKAFEEGVTKRISGR